MKLLILTSRFPFPIEKGDKLRIYHQIRLLSQRHKIILCALSEEEVSENHQEELKKYCDEIHLFKLRRSSFLFHMIRPLFSALPWQVAYFHRFGIHRKIRKIIRKTAPDLIYCQLVRMARYVPKASLARVIDYMDCFSVGMNRRAETSGKLLKTLFNWESKKLTQFERAVYKRFHSHCIISSQDADHLQLMPSQTISIVPNGVDVDYFQPDHQSEKNWELLFVGNMGYPPNVEAACYLVQEIMPLLWKEYPDLRLCLAGVRPHPRVQAFVKDDRISVTGWLPDIREAYQQGSIFVAPLFTGSGQQNKILEAMAMALPCITTPLVNNAIGAVDGETILLATDAPEFSQQIKRLLKNPEQAKQTGKAGRKLVEKEFSWEASVALLEEVFEEGLQRAGTVIK